jgi:hypothetical protein
MNKEWDIILAVINSSTREEFKTTTSWVDKALQNIKIKDNKQKTFYNFITLDCVFRFNRLIIDYRLREKENQLFNLIN